MALPTKVQNAIPGFFNCSAGWLSAYDPPKTLVPAAFMAPPSSSDDAAVTILPSVPDPSGLDTDSTQPPAPASTPKPDSPIQTLPPSSRQGPSLVPTVSDLAKPIASTAGAAPTALGSSGSINQNDIDIDHSSQGEPPEKSIGSKQNTNPSFDPELSSDPQLVQSSRKSVDPGSAVHSVDPETTDMYNNPTPGFDPSNVSPNQMSQIHDALGPDIQSMASPVNNPSPVRQDPQSGASTSDAGDLNAKKPSSLPGSVWSTNDRPPAAAVSTVSDGGHAIVIGPSAVHVDGSEVKPQGAPVTIASAAVINQGNTLILGDQIYQIPTATLAAAAATTIVGHAVTAM